MNGVENDDVIITLRKSEDEFKNGGKRKVESR